MLFETIAEPSRRLLALLLEAEQPVNALVAATGRSQPAVSNDLRVLREAGLVSVRRDGQRRVYRVRPEPLRELDTWLEPYRLVWSGRLDDLERTLEEMADE